MGSGISRQLFNCMGACTGGCIKLAEVYYSIHDIIVTINSVIT